MAHPNNLAVHVGFPKTATTTLQHDVFAKHSGLVNLGKPCFAENVEWHKAIRHLQTADEPSYRRSWCEDVLRSTVDTEPRSEATRLISHEGFTNILHNSPNRIANRLFSAFGSLRVVFTIREQSHFLQSFYLYYFKKGHVRKSFLRWRSVDRRRGKNSVQSLADYNQVIQHYIRTFGRENVDVLLFEEMANDPSTFAKNLSQTLSIDAAETQTLLESAGRHNERISSRSHRFYVACERLVPRPVGGLVTKGVSRTVQRRFKSWLDQGRQVHLKVPARVTREFHHRYAQGNRELTEEFDLDLRRYGYAM